jgi:ribonuclease HI
LTEWRMYIDGASLGNPGSSGAGVVAFDEQGKEVWRESAPLGIMTNNMAEYEALLCALRKARDASVDAVSVYTDSELVARQVVGTYRVKNERLKEYLHEVHGALQSFKRFDIKHIPREENGLADKLAKSAAVKNSG